ncbi:MAG: hypothetical protein HQ526_08925 [Actinobacteria bacterium]|nr:hypothetical protein [Actinomycetota bacterium]
MSVLAWWLIPILATSVAIVWVWWRSREGASETGRVTSAKELEKMARALEKPLPKGSQIPPRDGHAGE